MPDPGSMLIPDSLGTETSLDLARILRALHKRENLKVAILGFDGGALVSVLDEVAELQWTKAFLGTPLRSQANVEFHEGLAPDSFNDPPNVVILDAVNLPNPHELSLVEAAFCGSSAQAAVLVRSYDLVQMKDWLPYHFHKEIYERHLGSSHNYWEAVESLARENQYRVLERSGLRMGPSVLHGFDLTGWWASVSNALGLDSESPVNSVLKEIEQKGLQGANLDLFVKECLYFRGS